MWYPSSQCLPVFPISILPTYLLYWYTTTTSDTIAIVTATCHMCNNTHMQTEYMYTLAAFYHIILGLETFLRASWLSLPWYFQVYIITPKIKRSQTKSTHNWVTHHYTRKCMIYHLRQSHTWLHSRPVMCTHVSASQPSPPLPS